MSGATLPTDSSTNAAFFARHAAPGRIGLVAGSDATAKLIRKAQAPLTADRHRSQWSHAFVFSERRVDGHWWVIESDLDFRYRQIRVGVQENRIERYFDAAQFPNVAVLDFRLDAEQLRRVQVAALDLLSGLPCYSISELAGTMLAMYSRRLRRRRNLLEKDGALFCSALVQHCYAAAGIEFVAGVHGKNVAPHDLMTSQAPHDSHTLIRDLGISHLRRFAHQARELLETPVDELF